MALSLSNSSITPEVFGFQGIKLDWNEYIQYRPVYPPSFYARIYNHHSATRPVNAFNVVHDVGAGAGIVSELLAEKFNHVIVSEPNPEYIKMAKQRLSSLSKSFPKDKFSFRKELAEKSNLRDGSMDCVTICVALHWCDMPAAVAEFGRQLRSGGTLCIMHYGPPRILDNEEAQEAWAEFFYDYVDDTHEISGGPAKSICQRAIQNTTTGYDNIGFDQNIWEKGVERWFTNTSGDREKLALPKKFPVQGEPDKFGKEDKRLFIEDDREWETEGCSLGWFQYCLKNFRPGSKAVDKKQKWVPLETALGGREGKVTVTWPNLQIIATRR